MGGHEHREGSRSSRAGAWEGSDKLKKALEGLATAKGVSQSRIGAVAKLAAHYSKVSKGGRTDRGRRVEVDLILIFVWCSFTNTWCMTLRCFCGRRRSSIDWLVGVILC